MSSAANSSTSRGRSARSGGNRLMWIVVGLLVLVACAVILTISVLTFGRVAGVEFSPDTLSRRAFYYLELPWIGYRLTTVMHEDYGGALEDYLQSNTSLVPASPNQSPRWDLIRIQKGGMSHTDDAEILDFYLEDDLQEHNFWITWSTDHPELAKILWPAIVEVCRDGQYVFVPEVFDTARQLTAGGAKPGKDAFQTAIDRAVASQYVHLADTQQELEDLAAAIESYSLALKHDPNDQQALRDRALCYEAEGKSEQAKGDRQQLEKLKADNK